MAIAATNDLALLKAYAKTRDADAFGTLFRRHINLVYGTCLRVMGNTQDAEDAAQETFLELARKAGDVRTSVPGWLHRTAMHRASNAIREAARRRRREQIAFSEKESSGQPTWQEISPHVDSALDSLTEELRTVVILHYLQGLTQDQIAAQIGMHRSTVSRRLEKGVWQLRKKLSRVTVVPGVAILAGFLSANSAIAAPATLSVALGKMAIAGVGSSVAIGSLGETFSYTALMAILSPLKIRIIIAAAAALLALTSATVYQYSKSAEVPEAGGQMIRGDANGGATNDDNDGWKVILDQ